MYFLRNKKPNKLVLVLFITLFILAGIVTWRGWFSLLPVVGMILTTYGMWQLNEQMMRKTFLYGSPLWLIYGLSTGSIGGVLNEILNLISTSTALWRYRKTVLTHKPYDIILGMQETSRYAVGLDIGTSRVRVVVGHLEDPTQAPTIVGVASEPNSGMRKGTVVNLVNVAKAIDKALEAAERMGGYQVQHATVNINGSHIVGISSKGVIAVGASGHEISNEDLARVQEAATVLQLPANREIVEVTPRSYQLDGQENIKDPVGMTGVRLEVDAHVITALAPHVKNLEKACEMTETHIDNLVLSGLAAARSVLSEKQMENGVLLIDMGLSTTNLVVFDEGDLQHIAVLPVGGNNITNDLAIGLKTELDVAEQVKIQHAVAHSDLRRGQAGEVTVKVNDLEYSFDTSDIDMIVDARLEEVFEQINSELKSIGRAAQLPGGVVLTGGGAELKGIADYAKQALQLSVRIGQPSGFAGIGDQVNNPSYAVATGLMLSNLLDGAQREQLNDSGSNLTGGFMKQLNRKLSQAFSKKST